MTRVRQACDANHVAAEHEESGVGGLSAAAAGTQGVEPARRGCAMADDEKTTGNKVGI